MLLRIVLFIKVMKTEINFKVLPLFQEFEYSQNT